HGARCSRSSRDFGGHFARARTVTEPQVHRRKPQARNIDAELVQHAIRGATARTEQSYEQMQSRRLGCTHARGELARPSQRGVQRTRLVVRTATRRLEQLIAIQFTLPQQLSGKVAFVSERCQEMRAGQALTPLSRELFGLAAQLNEFGFGTQAG